MISISSSEAFLILGKWRENNSQLQLTIRSAGKTVGSPARITETSPSDESISALIVLDGQTQLCRLDFRGASFQYGEPSDSALFPEFAEGKWASYLLVEVPSGNVYFFAERFVESR